MFLQGHPSFFACRLADELERHGHRALRINLCLGDALYWFNRHSTSYRGRYCNWPGFLRDFIKKEGVTDILYYGDRRPYHIAASEVARELGINAFAYEFGYLRPDWLTIEQGGMSVYSHFPDDPAEIMNISRGFEAPDMDRKYPYSKSGELFNEVVYNLLGYLIPIFYPFYKADRYYNLLLEYVSGIPGLFLEGRNERRAQKVIGNLVAEDQNFFLFPLQLQSDYQIRANSNFNHQGEAIERAIISFAGHAQPEHHLLFKQHPLDNGWEGWSKLTENLARSHGISERVHFVIGGDLDLLLEHTRGCVVINSSVGLHAVQADCPVKALGKAIYDIDGICHQGSLDDFWNVRTSPDVALTDALVRALAGTIQVKGNFFTKEGQTAAIPAMANMLIDGQVNGHGAYVDPPPRLAGLRSKMA